MSLHSVIDVAVRTHGSRAAAREVGGQEMDYRTLGELSDRLHARLAALGVTRGDRVGIYLRKSIDALVSVVGILKAGATYVPVDPSAPASRNAYIHSDCGVKVCIVEKRLEKAYREELAKAGADPQLIVLEGTGAGHPLRAALDALDASRPAPARPMVETAPDDLAYILYTSGSTGRPKGVMLSHENASSFVDWCSETFEPASTDVFSSHAPFHFDLSILDIYVPLKHGAVVVLIPDDVGKDPLALSSLISRHRLTVWYSAPSILSLLGQFGQIPEHDYSTLRTVLFAGEVFPLVHLRLFKGLVPKPRYYNLYGPTETNVCTFFEIPSVIPDDRTDPYPIGKVCSNLRGKVVDVDGTTVAAGQEGELCIAGPNVMKGYWGMPEQTAKSFLADPTDRWYKTGDVVAEDANGDYRYVGRRDRMVKKRGYRVELGEIEACLYRHDAIREAAVVSLADPAEGVKIKAHLSVRGEARPSLIELKTFCSKSLPLYMVPDFFAFHPVLPKTSTDKVDYVALKNLG